MAESLDSFLQKSQTGSVESSGSFTMDVTRALKKMQTSQLVNCGEQLLKFVQAANVLNAGQIEFTIGVRSVKAAFNFLYDDSVSAPAVAEVISGQSQGRSLATRHLGIGLRAALGMGATRVRWTLGPKHYVEVGQGPGVCHDAPLSGVVRGEVELKRKSWLQGVKAKTQSLDHYELYNECRHSPCRVMVDKRPIERGWPRQATRAQRGFGSGPYFLMEGYMAPTSDLPAFPVWCPGQPKGLWKNPEFTADKRQSEYQIGSGMPSWSMPTLFRYVEGGVRHEGDSLHCGAAFALPMRLEGPTQLNFVLDGVTSAPEVGEMRCPGLQCLVSGQGLRVDLTEFQTVENEVYLSRIQAMWVAARRYMNRVQECRDEFLYLRDLTNMVFADQQKTKYYRHRNYTLANLRI